MAVSVPLQPVQGQTNNNDFNNGDGDIINNNSENSNTNNNNNGDGDTINNNSGNSTTINNVNGGDGNTINNNNNGGTTKIDPSACAAVDKEGSPLQNATGGSPYLTCIYQDDTVCKYSSVDGSLFSESGSSFCPPLVVSSTPTPPVTSAASQSVSHPPTASVNSIPSASASSGPTPVKGSARPLQRISVGAVAGIVLAVVVALISLATFLLCRRRRLRTRAVSRMDTISPFRPIPEASGPDDGSALHRQHIATWREKRVEAAERSAGVTAGPTYREGLDPFQIIQTAAGESARNPGVRSDGLMDIDPEAQLETSREHVSMLVNRINQLEGREESSGWLGHSGESPPEYVS
ncbi:hypothetical protein DFH06DRAFT_1223507 [Mycena polygramma]|nr:hypothetical protein DFH06DRAFT_1223507 [Mycena polygramma]